VTAYLIGAVWGLVGAAAGVGIRQLSVWLARREDLEPGFKRWQVWGPVLTAAVVFAAFGSASRASGPPCWSR
jgi:hypothetical protein